MAVSDDYDLRRVKGKIRLSNEQRYLMALADERGAEHVDVVLDTPNFWMKEVRDHTVC
jgi:hypothetical protein